MHATQPLSARPRHLGTENHHFDDRDAGCGECRHPIATSRSSQIADQGSGGLSSPLGGALIIQPPRSQSSVDGSARNLPEAACFRFRSRINDIGSRKSADASAFLLELLLSSLPLREFRPKFLSNEKPSLVKDWFKNGNTLLHWVDRYRLFHSALPDQAARESSRFDSLPLWLLSSVLEHAASCFLEA